MLGFGPEVRQLLLSNGCYMARQGKGDHELWYSPRSKARCVVPYKIMSRRTANAVLKQARLPKAF
ncbi:MAG: type II toxin-antitoxin system HicA family toxin [Candidatus Binataceae bacterium]